MKYIAFSLFFLLFSVHSLFGQMILIDDDFSDWQNTPAAYTDTNGDNGFSSIDFGKLWINNDEAFLFFNIEVTYEINLQESNQITIYIDTDDDQTTGFAINGIGADLEYSFGNRNGKVYLENETFTVHQNDIRLVTAPTVSSKQFEIAISRELIISGQTLFQGDSIRVVFKDNSGNWDVLPNEPGGVLYNFVQSSPEPLPEYALSKTSEEHLRVLSYNVLHDGLFDAARAPSMSRLLQVINPDVIGFQEIYKHNAAQVAGKMETILPSGENEQWYHAKEGPDIVAVSRYPVLNSFPIGNNGAFLLDLNSQYGVEALFIVAHPPCCGNNTNRQLEIDAIMAFIRDAKNGTGPLQLEENAPIIIAGDMNLVGYNQQLNTLLTGNIVNESTYGPDFQPDWDGSDLKDSRPYTTNLPMNFTWFSESSHFSPGRLDFIIFTNSVLELANAFTLFTRTLSPDTLNAYNLLQEDAVIASDHLPVVSDFFLNSTSGTGNIATPDSGCQLVLNNHPNPASQSTDITYQLPENAFVTLSLTEIAGMNPAIIVSQFQSPGLHSFELNTSALERGLYFLNLKAGDCSAFRKMMILR